MRRFPWAVNKIQVNTAGEVCLLDGATLYKRDKAGNAMWSVTLPETGVTSFTSTPPAMYMHGRMATMVQKFTNTWPTERSPGLQPACGGPMEQRSMLTLFSGIPDFAIHWIILLH